MSSRKINTRNSFYRKKDFFDVLSLISLAIRLYCNYIMSSKIYCVNNNFKKCIKYMRFNCNYNLTIFFTSIKQIYKEQIHLKKEMRNI